MVSYFRHGCVQSVCRNNAWETVLGKLHHGNLGLKALQDSCALLVLKKIQIPRDPGIQWIGDITLSQYQIGHEYLEWSLLQVWSLNALYTSTKRVIATQSGGGSHICSTATWRAMKQHRRQYPNTCILVKLTWNTSSDSSSSSTSGIFMEYMLFGLLLGGITLAFESGKRLLIFNVCWPVQWPSSNQGPKTFKHIAVTMSKLGVDWWAP